MKNFLNLAAKRPTVDVVLSVSQNSPKAGVDLAQKGIILTHFEDWLRIATKAALSSPYSPFWREVALKYPEPLVVKNLNLFFDVLKSKPILLDQARALLLLVQSRKLPTIPVLRNICAENEEQERIKELLIRKKSLGDERFCLYCLSEVVKALPENKVSFLIDSGSEVTFESDVFISSVVNKKKRLLTLFGMATVVAERRKFFEESGFVTHYFILIDGEQSVRKMRETNFENLKVGKKLRMMVTR